MRKLCSLALGLLAIISTTLYISCEPPPVEPTPIYVTVAGHIEDGRYYADCERYPEYRDQLLEFAELIASHGIPFNLQIDYELFQGASRCESP